MPAPATILPPAKALLSDAQGLVAGNNVSAHDGPQFDLLMSRAIGLPANPNQTKSQTQTAPANSTKTQTSENNSPASADQLPLYQHPLALPHLDQMILPESAVIQAIVDLETSAAQNPEKSPGSSSAGKSSAHGTKSSEIQAASGTAGKVNGQGVGSTVSPNGPGLNAKSLVELFQPKQSLVIHSGTSAAAENAKNSASQPAPGSRAITETALTEKILLANTGKPAPVLDSNFPPGQFDKDSGQTSAFEKPATETSLPPTFSPDDLTTKTPATMVPVADGTSAAKQDTAMKSAEKTIKNGSLPGKILPVSAASVPRENNLPGRGDLTAASVGSGYGQSTGSSTSVATVQNVVAIPSAANAQIQTLERTQTLLSIHALRMASASMDSLQVVIRPDTGTQLNLELRQHGDTIEAQATLQQGNFAGLNQHWPELQRQLEQRGIQLAPLAEENSFNAGHGGNFHQKENYSSAETEPADAYAPVALATLSGSASSPSSATRGWETWA